MVIHEEEQVTKTKSSKNMAAKSYVIVENHIKELPKRTSKRLHKADKTTIKKKKPKKQCASEEISIPKKSLPTEAIDNNDLLELKKVYKKCKSIVSKIEQKYGHLLDLPEGTVEWNANEKCCCQLNNKIVFSDDGSQISSDNKAIHICRNKLVTKPKSYTEPISKSRVETTEEESLPNDVVSLENLLKNTDIDKSYRYAVITKLKMLKQEISNDIRFNKELLIAELKSDPESALRFVGTNLASLEGYKDS